MVARIEEVSAGLDIFQRDLVERAIRQYLDRHAGEVGHKRGEVGREGLRT
ncbi:MAG: hypothetical protein IRZ11_00690 [Clostridia bacterium]|nr:hypothetical protein [Clostridia bacterium]